MSRLYHTGGAASTYKVWGNMTQSRAIWKSSFSDCIINWLIKLSGPTVFFLCEKSLFILDSNSLKHYLGFTSLLEPNFVQDALFFSVSQVALGKEPICQCRRRKKCGFYPWVGKIPWRRAWQPTPIFLPGEPQGQRSLAGYSPYVRKDSDRTEAT